jgi:hypothetical protein
MKPNANTEHPKNTDSSTATEAQWSAPVLKPWMIRVFQGAGIDIPPPGSDRDRLAWQGVEIQRFLGFSRTLAAGTSLPEALDAYGRELKSRKPALEEWRLHQAREALRAFRRGSESWEIIDGENGLEVKFRTKSTHAEGSFLGVDQ